MPIVGVAGNLIERGATRSRYAVKKKTRTKRPVTRAPVPTQPYKASTKVKDWHIYVLKLQHGCFYVGITSRSEIHWRYRKHVHGSGAQWTRLHSPVSVYDTYRIGRMSEVDAVEVETRKTMALMSQHGVSKVRGGYFIYSDDTKHRASVDSYSNVSISKS